MRLTLNFIKAGVIFDHYKKIEIRSQLRGKLDEHPLNVSGGFRIILSHFLLYLFLNA
jgi:hypothetical protein